MDKGKTDKKLAVLHYEVDAKYRYSGFRGDVLPIAVRFIIAVAYLFNSWIILDLCCSNFSHVFAHFTCQYFSIALIMTFEAYLSNLSMCSVLRDVKYNFRIRSAARA